MMEYKYILIFVDCLFLMNYACQPDDESPEPHLLGEQMDEAKMRRNDTGSECPRPYLRSEHQYLWVGINNYPHIIGVTEKDLDKLFIVSGNDTTYNPYGSSSIRVRGKDEGMQTVALYKIKENGEHELLKEKTFKTRYLPDPISGLGGRLHTRTGEMRLGEARGQRGILCALMDWDYSITNGRQEFNILGRKAGGKDTLYHSNTGAFTDEQKAYIRTLKPGQHLIIKDVRILMPGDKKPRTLNPLIYKIIK